MKDIQKIAIDTYTENLNYIKENDKILYNKIIHLSEIINNNQYNEKYYLEYIKEEEQFDIFDIDSNRFIYNKKPTQYNKKVLKVTNYDTRNSYTLLKEGYYNNKDSKTFCSISEYVNIFNQKIDTKNKKLKKIEKFVFIGTILGSHIPLLDNKLNSNVYFISEPNLEIFRLSLFVVDYSKIALNSNIIFSVMDTRREFIHKFNQYLIQSFKDNYMIKYYSTSFHINDYFDRILEAIGVYTPFGFPYTYILNMLLKPSFENMAKYKLINTMVKHNLLQDKPVLILAAGPSLSKNIDWIKENQDNFFIVAISATLIKLCSNDIKPNLIVSADPAELNVKHIPDSIKETIKGIPFIASTMSHHKLLNRLDLNDIYLFEVMTQIKDISSSISGASIGEVTFHLSVILGAQEIYLIGTDLALDQEKGTTHIDDYFANKEFDIKEQDSNDFTKKGVYSHKNTTMVVKGNFSDEVITTSNFAQSIHAYNVIIKGLKNKNSKINIFNLSDGAYIDNTIPYRISDVKLDNILKINNNSSIEYLNNFSELAFTNVEIVNIKQSAEFVDICIEKLNQFAKLKVKNYGDFTSQRTEIFNLLLIQSKKYKKYYLSELFINYILMTEPYIAYNFNGTVSNESNLIKKIKKVWASQVLSICNKYKEIVLQENN